VQEGRKVALNNTVPFQAFTTFRYMPHKYTEPQTFQLVNLNLNELSMNVNHRSIDLLDDINKVDITIGGINFKFESYYDRFRLEAAIVRNIPHSISLSILNLLIEKLLAGASFGTNMEGGGIGYKKESDDTFQIIMYAPFKIRNITNEFGLIEFIPKFKKSAEDWITRIQEHIRVAKSSVETVKA